MVDSNEYYLRQKEFIPDELREQAVVSIVGTGAVGKQVALQLASMGFKEFNLIDPDAVEAVNVGAQGFPVGAVGAPKVEAVKQLMVLAAEYGDKGKGIVTHRLPYEYRLIEGSTVVFCCVDSMAVRREIYGDIQRSGMYTVLVDARMSGEVIRVLGIDNWHKAGDELDAELFKQIEAGVLWRYLATTLFSDAEAVQDRCTARMTLYAANIAAGMLISTYAAILRGRLVLRDSLLDLGLMQITDMVKRAGFKAGEETTEPQQTMPVEPIQSQPTRNMDELLRARLDEIIPMPSFLSRHADSVAHHEPRITQTDEPQL